MKLIKFKPALAAMFIAVGMTAGVANAAEKWAGASIGFNISQYDYKNTGHGNSFDDPDDDALFVWSETNKSTSDKGTGFGLTAGYNWQTNNLVYGVLADLTYIGAAINKETAGGISDGEYSFKRVDKLNWLGTVRGKFGVDVNGFLPYLTAGVALGEVKNQHQTITCCPTLFESTINTTKVGYVVGFGIEKKVNVNLGINLDYSYINLGKSSGSANGIVGEATANPSRVKLENEVSIINLGLNYYF